jgi:DNA-directed RNA polymerase subunit RPC12/RpoP
MKKNHEWRTMDWESCPKCGEEVEVYTHVDTEPNQFWDQDEVRCPKCGPCGQVSADGEAAWVSFSEEFE